MSIRNHRVSVKPRVSDHELAFERRQASVTAKMMNRLGGLPLSTAQFQEVRGFLFNKLLEWPPETLAALEKAPK